ncbi:MAG: hypothetical protein H0X30_03895 [Anaerolineae bacterium]|nr:hypothetical protein [Anaerolineae bacterium]
MKIRMIGLVLGTLLMGACSALGSSPVKQFVKGEELAFYDFTAPATFEEGLYGNNTARLQISSGVYNIQLSAGDNNVYYGQWGATLDDTVIEVEANQTSADLNSTYGVMCRMRGTVGQIVKANPEATPDASEPAGSDTIIAAGNSEATLEATADATAEATLEATQEVTAEATQKVTAEATSQADTSNATTDNKSNNGDGYLFVVEGNGKYAIMRSQGHKITPLINWTSSSAVNSGAAQNSIRAICMGNYLAMYVNDQFVADTTDSMYTKGQLGLVAASAGRTGMIVTFDNLTVYQAKPG